MPLLDGVAVRLEHVDGANDDAPLRDFVLSGDGDFVAGRNARRAPALLLVGPQPGDDAEFERVQTIRTLDHVKPSRAQALVRAWPEWPRLKKAGGSEYSRFSGGGFG
jgi:hypothetical protein